MGFISDYLAKIKKQHEAEVKSQQAQAKKTVAFLKEHFITAPLKVLGQEQEFFQHPIKNIKKEVAQIKESTNKPFPTKGTPEYAKLEKESYEKISNLALGFTMGLRDINVVKSLVKANTVEAVKKIVNVSDEVAGKIAKSTDETVIKKLLQTKPIVPKIVPEISQPLAQEAIPKITPAETAEALRTTPPITPSPVSPTGIPTLDENAKKGVQTLIDLNQKMRGITEKLYTEERGTRFGQAEAVYKAGQGEKGALAGLGKLGGELPKATIPPELQTKLINELTPEVRNSLYNTIQTHPWLNTGEKSTGIGALRTMLDTKVFTPLNESEINVLETAFGSDFGNVVRQIQKQKITIGGMINEVNGVLRFLQTGFDLGATLTQNAFYTVAHPLKMAKIIGQTAKAAVNPTYFENIQKAITGLDTYPLARKFGVPFTKIGGTGVKLAQQEEQFLMRFLNNIPYVGQVVQAPNRAWVAMNNLVRAQSFDTLAKKCIELGLSPINDAASFKRVANFVGAVSGRGSLGKAGNEALGLLNGIFYSPRLNAARLYFLNPLNFIKGPTPVRKEMWRILLSYAGLQIGVVSLMAMRDEKIETNPISSDWGKLRIGDTRMDTSLKMAQWINLAARVVTGKTKNTNTGEITDINRTDVVIDFLKNKLGPIPGMATYIGDALSSKKQPLTLGGLSQRELLHFTIQDIVDAWDADPWLKTVIGTTSFFGLPVQTYKAQPSSTFKIKDYTTSGRSNTFKIKDYTK